MASKLPYIFWTILQKMNTAMCSKARELASELRNAFVAVSKSDVAFSVENNIQSQIFATVSYPAIAATIFSPTTMKDCKEQWTKEAITELDRYWNMNSLEEVIPYVGSINTGDIPHTSEQISHSSKANKQAPEGWIRLGLKYILPHQVQQIGSNRSNHQLLIVNIENETLF